VSSVLAARRRQPGFELRSGQLAVIALLLILAIVAWIVTDLRMAGMDAGPGTDPGAFGFYITTWVVMMAAMMFPSIAPMVLTFRTLQGRRREQGLRVPAGVTGLFVGGYLGVWAASGLIGYAVLKEGRALDGGLFAWDSAGRWVAVAVLVAAAVYEFTPLKRACLVRCRSPLGFLMGSWRDGSAGALRMGAEHGAWCLGCCWALMAALFALGAMSLAWMLLIGALIAAEKLLPWARASSASVAVVLGVLALGIAVSPASVPALTVPGSPAAMRAMDEMSGSGSMSHSGSGTMSHSGSGTMSHSGSGTMSHSGSGEVSKSSSDGMSKSSTTMSGSGMH
jgi:predicted metal-binding membrane protein